jgi:hypothetical protein
MIADVVDMRRNLPVIIAAASKTEEIGHRAGARNFLLLPLSNTLMDEAAACSSRGRES